MFEDEDQAVETKETEPQEPEIDDLWDEEDGGMAAQGGDQPLEKPGEGEPQTSGEPAPEKQDEETPEPPREGEKTTPQPESFTLRHLDDPPVTVGRDEVVRLAQQGLDYERVRTERDQLREYRTQAEPALKLVKTFAENSGMTLEDYVDYCRTQAIVAGGVDEATAKVLVEMEKRQAKLDTKTEEPKPEQQRQQAAQDKAQQEAEARKQDMMAFIGAYPEVKATDIPKEVWDKVAGGQSLVSAYTMYQNRQLKARIAAREQNEKNAAKAPGSMKTQGEKGKKTLADLWDEADE